MGPRFYRVVSRTKRHPSRDTVRPIRIGSSRALKEAGSAAVARVSAIFFYIIVCLRIGVRSFSVLNAEHGPRPRRRHHCCRCLPSATRRRRAVGGSHINRTYGSAAHRGVRLKFLIALRHLIGGSRSS